MIFCLEELCFVYIHFIFEVVKYNTNILKMVYGNGSLLGI